MDDYLRDSVSYKKDVEGLCFQYRHNLYRNIRYLDSEETVPQLKCLLPCTALACVKILESLGAYDPCLSEGQGLTGQVVTIINRSEIVGRPLAALLANDGAEIYSIDIDSTFLFRRGVMKRVDISAEDAIRLSNVVVTGVPTNSYKLPTAWIQPNTIVINVSSFHNVDGEELLSAVPGVRYVPAVGKVTVTMLERNLLRLYKNFHSANATNPNFRYYIEPSGPRQAKASISAVEER
jgi:methylenetetrahydrofolate dehydrogenase (NAD+)